MRQGERSFQLIKADVAQAGVLSVWQTLQAFGICDATVSDGVTKWNVWLLTLISPRVCSIFGIWQAVQALPGLSGLWCVCASIVAACGPFCVFGPWQSMHTELAGLRNIA